MSTELAVIEKLAPIDLFKPEVIDPIIGKIRTEALDQAAKLDISTPGNRKELASLSYKIARSKTFIDDQRKALVADEKKRLAVIDAEGRRVWNEFESLQAEVRKPLTDWENAEKERVAAHEKAIAEIPESSMYGATETSQEIEYRLQFLQATYVSRDWQEFGARAKQVIDAEILRTKDIMERIKVREEQAAELARLRAEAAEREQRDREERIAREVKERAEREAKAREEQAAREAAEREARLEREARQREHDVIIAKEAAEMKARKAEADRIAAEERHAREKQAAIEAERQRVANEKRRAEEEAKAREKDKAHRAEVNNTALEALVAAGLSNDDARKAITAIAKGQIPNVKVAY
jgi:hypothetical protein